VFDNEFRTASHRFLIFGINNFVWRCLLFTFRFFIIAEYELQEEIMTKKIERMNATIQNEFLEKIS
jgi:hypothetical protein